MSASHGEKPQGEFCLWRALWLTVVLASSANAPGAFGQDQANGAVRKAPPQEDHVHQAVTPLQDLLNEAEQNNPQIQVARLGWQAAKQVPS